MRVLTGGVVLGLVLALLAACNATAPEPTPDPGLLPIPAGPTARSLEPAPTVVAEGISLPGRLLFVKGGDLWLWQGEEGSQLTRTGDAFQPAWSPDGTWIAYIQRGESYSDLMVMPSAGGEPLRLTDDGSSFPQHSFERVYDTMWAFYPAFSPEGDEIGFASQYGPPGGSPAVDYHLGLFVTPPGAGGARRLLYVDETGHVGRLAYAPDGSTIVFAFSPVGTNPPQLYRFTRATGTAEPLQGAPEQSYDPAFSPDGRWLAFAARDGERTDIFVMPVAGGEPVRITSIGTARAPAFSPDGTTLAFLAIAPGSHIFDLWVVDLQAGVDGAPVAGQPRQVTQDMGIDADSGTAWGR